MLADEVAGHFTACAIVLWASACGAQSATFYESVGPNPAIAGRPVWLDAILPGNSCVESRRIVAVTHAGQEVTVTYVLEPLPEIPPCGLPPPLALHAPLGALGEGSYVAKANGSRNGVPLPGFAVAFTVLPAGRVALEYFHPLLQHYFLTADPREIDLLDRGVVAGWLPTQRSFAVGPADAAGGAWSPVCRYYGLPSAGLDSHFHSASPEECARVAQRFPQAWLLESPNVFEVVLPDAVTGACPAGTTPVYRLYNNRPDANHRYTTSLLERSSMLTSFWMPEGYGPDGVAMCAPTTG